MDMNKQRITIGKNETIVVQSTSDNNSIQIGAITGEGCININNFDNTTTPKDIARSIIDYIENTENSREIFCQLKKCMEREGK